MTMRPQDELLQQLLSLGIVVPQELEKLQQQAAETASDLEAVLRKNRVLTDPQLCALQALRAGGVYCNVSDYLPRLQNARLVPEELARRHVMFPLFHLGDVITLVMDDPHDLTGIDQVRRHTKKEVDVCVGTRREIMGLIERAYGASKYLETSSIAQSLMETAAIADSDSSQPVIRLVDDLISEAIRQRASDIHIEPGESELRIRIRVDGVLREVAAPPLALHRALVSRIKIMARLDISRTRSPQDGAFHHRVAESDAVIRVSVLPTVFGEAVVLRILRNESESISLPDLGMTPAMLKRFQALVTNTYGMILVSGPTGSGKSTTLYAAMKVIASPQKNIVAIEDPVEYRTSKIRQVQVNPEANLTFAGGLRSVLRQDPDVIMVGEIRDSETAQISVQAALTGHLVLSTVHTNDSIGAVSRLRDLGIAEYLISASLLVVLAQRLCRRNCPECVADDAPSEILLQAIGLDRGRLDFVPRRGKGCRRCAGTGYVGRLGIFELFELNERYAQMIVRREPPEVLRAAACEDGMEFLLHDGVNKIRQGWTSVEEVARVAGRS